MSDVNGVTHMSIKQLRNYAYYCILNYATYNIHLQQYVLDVNDLPDFVLSEFAAHIMADDDDRANECTGCDNPRFYSSMLPSLINFLKMSDKESEEDFVKAWKDGITNYHKKYMSELINDALLDHNSDNIFSDETVCKNKGNHIWTS
jgi:hypothetical protein